MRKWLFALVLLGCDPSPPSGAYLCSTADNACPSGQMCECGLCVKKASDAACSFRIDGADGLKVNEHQNFDITIVALDKNKAESTGFNGTVSLQSTWGDITPAQAKLTNGRGTVTVQLNRETIDPATAKIRAVFADKNIGDSGKIEVEAPPFSILPTEINPPFSWAETYVAEGDVVKSGGLWRMYYIGLSVVPTRYGVGVATSTDGVTFTPGHDKPVFISTADFVFSPAGYSYGDTYYLAYSGQPPESAGVTPPSRILLASGPDGTMPFAFANAGNPIIAPSSCAYCGGGVTYPTVLPDSRAPEPHPLLMFFSAANEKTGNVSIGRASSEDGVTWTPEPAPLLSGDLSGEAVLLSPRVYIDGSVFKMWYSFARIPRFQPCTVGVTVCPANTQCIDGSCQAPKNPNDPFAAFCVPGFEVQVGYATSQDGLFWTRSISNPVIKVTDPGMPANTHAMIVSSVIAKDGVNPSQGMYLFFSTFRRVLALGNRCIPNGITRATRP